MAMKSITVIVILLATISMFDAEKIYLPQDDDTMTEFQVLSHPSEKRQEKEWQSTCTFWRYSKCKRLLQKTKAMLRKVQEEELRDDIHSWASANVTASKLPRLPVKVAEAEESKRNSLRRISGRLVSLKSLVPRVHHQSRQQPHLSTTYNQGNLVPAQSIPVNKYEIDVFKIEEQPDDDALSLDAMNIPQ